MTELEDTQESYVCECGESRIDYLVWIDDNLIRCETCGAIIVTEEAKDEPA